MKLAMYLPTGVQTLKAATNLLHPEEVMERVNSLTDLEREAVTVIVPDGAYKGKCVMTGDSVKRTFLEINEILTLSIWSVELASLMWMWCWIPW